MKKLTYFKKSGCVLFVFILFLGCEKRSMTSQPIVPPPGGSTHSVQLKEYQYNHKIINDDVYDNEPKPVVALLRTGDIIELGDVLPFGRQMIIQPSEEKEGFTVVSKQGESEVVLPRNVSEYLTRGLVNSGKLIVVERERIIEIVRELTVSESEVVEPTTATKKGRLLGVHYILEGVFFRAGSDAANEIVMADPRYKEEKNTNNQSVLMIKAYDVETGQIVSHVIGVDENTAVATQKAVKQLLQSLKGKKDTNIRVISFDPNGNPVLDRGSATGIKKGDHFIIPTSDNKMVRMEAWEVDPLSCVVKILNGDKESLVMGDVAKLQK